MSPPVDTTFCTPYNLGPHSLMMLELQGQGWFMAQSDENWLEESFYGKYNLFWENKTIFGKEKQRKP